MRKMLIGAASAATLFVASFTAVPALAQVDLHLPGVGVQIGPDRDYRRWRDRDGYYHYGWRRDRPCRTVTVRERTPDGRVIVRTRERC